MATRKDIKILIQARRASFEHHNIYQHVQAEASKSVVAVEEIITARVTENHLITKSREALSLKYGIDWGVISSINSNTYWHEYFGFANSGSTLGVINALMTIGNFCEAPLLSGASAIQAALLGLALFTVILRCWTRLYYERKKLTLSEYFAWMGWIFALGWFITSTLSMLILVHHPPAGPDLLIPSVDYQKTVWIAEYFFDTGIYWPKLSILAFYWYLIPDVFQFLRAALYAITTYLISCMTASILLNTLIARPISDNWSVENQLNSAWNSLPNFLTQWCLNFSTDLLLFCFPFFILEHLTLRTEQKLGLVGVFSLGAITMSVSLTRFIISNAADYQLDEPSGNALCMAEMATAVVVVCLPGLKKLIMRSRTNTTSQGSNSKQSTSGHSSNMTGSRSKTASQAYAEWGVMDDEIELATHPQQSHLPGELQDVGKLL
ncbi:hypothetical protein FGADI_11424 [Fusarium gaditjirri]|uniref:Rhodopsin domain-containing protein n=1 Tax=Fusarium gaditjirri TaxID=282569 RepID=A0A8H4SUL8_9HYPO|nr:hypothetical protein FGADI_11424 [Fusarium gaditjirri]